VVDGGATSWRGRCYGRSSRDGEDQGGSKKLSEVGDEPDGS
jgi:hypothetical protein